MEEGGRREKGKGDCVFSPPPPFYSARSSKRRLVFLTFGGWEGGREGEGKRRRTFLQCDNYCPPKEAMSPLTPTHSAARSLGEGRNTMTARHNCRSLSALVSFTFVLYFVNHATNNETGKKYSSVGKRARGKREVGFHSLADRSRRRRRQQRRRD